MTKPLVMLTVGLVLSTTVSASPQPPQDGHAAVAGGDVSVAAEAGASQDIAEPVGVPKVVVEQSRPTPPAQQDLAPGPLSIASPSDATSSGGWYWLQIVSAASFGAIVVKLLDILWLAPVTKEAERRKWLRDQRLAAYADVARDALSLRIGGDQDHENPFQAYAVASRAILLAHNDDLASRIDQFIVDLDHFYELDDDKTKQAEAKTEYEGLSDRARTLIKDMRSELTQK